MEDFDFEKAFKELEEINEYFRHENFNLEEALKKFERGLFLIKKCEKRLKEIENKFEDVKKKFLEM